MPDQRSPREGIVDVLASARIESPFTVEEIADSIMHALAMAGADRQPDPAPTRIPVQAIKIIEKLQFSIDVFDKDGNLVEVLGRLSRLDMARAAFDLCISQTDNHAAAEGTGDRGEQTKRMIYLWPS